MNGQLNHLVLAAPRQTGDQETTLARRGRRSKEKELLSPPRGDALTYTVSLLLISCLNNAARLVLLNALGHMYRFARGEVGGPVI